MIFKKECCNSKCITLLLKIAVFLCAIQIYSYRSFSQVVSQADKEKTSGRKTSSLLIKELTVGDKVPSIHFEKVLNRENKKIELSEIKSKLVILDFWATWCSPCINNLPKLYKLQKEFGNQIQILLVNALDEDAETANSFFEKRKTRTGESLSLPFILPNSTLASYFPHRFLPHYVWLGKSDSVVAITSAEEVTESNIQSFLNGEHLHLHYKSDKLSYDSKENLLVKGNKFIYRSMIIPFQPDLGAFSGQVPAENGKMTKYFIINYSLRSLIQIAYNDLFKKVLNRTIIEINDSTRLEDSNNITVKFKNRYCYEIVTPPITFSEMITDLRNDLYRSFHISVKIERRQISCYVLVAKELLKKYMTTGGPPRDDLEKNSLKKFIHNEPISSLIQAMAEILPDPIIDETNWTQNLDIQFPPDFFTYDFNKLKEFLSQKGVEIIQTRREMDVAVITDKNSTN
jgi:uncharacterized protein (TIGR03435 family)